MHMITFDVDKMLQDGKSQEEILKMAQDRLKGVLEEKANKQKQNDAVAHAREKYVKASVNYMKALGALPEEDEGFEKFLEESILKEEKDTVETAKMMNMLGLFNKKSGKEDKRHTKEKEVNKDEAMDAVIRDFFRGLGI